MNDESFVFLMSLILSGHFLVSWYSRLFLTWRPRPNWPLMVIGGGLPLLALAAMLYTLTCLASFDVVDSHFYIFYYVVLGYAFILGGLYSMWLLFDLSWIDDLMISGNPAARPAVAGGLLGICAIYCGANIGDGPGWWCVVFAGGLGLGVWLALGLILARSVRVFERITIDRDFGCGLRTGGYLLASGLILGRASAGDWTGFGATLVEFLDGWPVLFLTGLAWLVERLVLPSDPLEQPYKISLLSKIRN